MTNKIPINPNIINKSFLIVLSRWSGRFMRDSRLRSKRGITKLNRSGIMKPTSLTIWCMYPSPRKTFCMNWSTEPAMMWSKAVPTMHKTFRDVTWLSLSAKWSTNVVENSSVNCEGWRDYWLGFVKSPRSGKDFTWPCNLPWKIIDDTTANRSRRWDSSSTPTTHNNARISRGKIRMPWSRVIALIWWAWWDIWCIRTAIWFQLQWAAIFWACLWWRWSKSFCKKRCPTRRSPWKPCPSKSTNRISCQRNERKPARAWIKNERWISPWLKTVPARSTTTQLCGRWAAASEI